MDKLTTLLACLPKSPFKDNLTEEIESLRQQLAAAKETDLLLRNLLCVIHRDGGHHITAHGLDQSVQDAMEVFYNLRDLPEQLAAALAACEAKDTILRGITLYRAFNGDDWPAREATQALTINPDASALKAHDEALIEKIKAQGPIAYWDGCYSDPYFGADYDAPGIGKGGIPLYRLPEGD